MVPAGLVSDPLTRRGTRLSSEQRQQQKFQVERNLIHGISVSPVTLLSSRLRLASFFAPCEYLRRREAREIRG
jgi:hypothetical protein